jgi:ankyrin repeat and BTB/POZ domain-containing protein 1
VKEILFKARGIVLPHLHACLKTWIKLRLRLRRCLYNALNDRIRNLLLKYDYSKTTDPLQPLASHFTSLLTRTDPHTSDITLTASNQSFDLHKYILSARSPYFRRKLETAPEITTFKIPNSIAPQSFDLAIRNLYFGEVALETAASSGTALPEESILAGVEKLSRLLEIDGLSETVLETDRRIARQRRQDEVGRGRDQIYAWFRSHVLAKKRIVNLEEAKEVKWKRGDGTFADILLRADEDSYPEDAENSLKGGIAEPRVRQTNGPLDGIPVGPITLISPSVSLQKPQSYLYPVHRAQLLRSEFFLTMFTSSFKEAADPSESEHLQIISIDCPPDVLEVVLTFLYTEKADFSLDIAVDILFAADMLFLEKLKIRAAVIISTLGNGAINVSKAHTNGTSEMIKGSGDLDEEDDALDIYDVIRAGWLTRVPRLEEFGAKYIADRLEDYIDEEAFQELIKESANRIQARQETDTIELLDDIRFYLSERFRMHFEDTGFEELMNEAPNEQVRDSPGDNDHSGANSSHTQTTATNLEPAKEGYGMSGQMKTLDGEDVGDEFEEDAMKYEMLLSKIETLLERLKLDA